MLFFLMTPICWAVQYCTGPDYFALTQRHFKDSAVTSQDLHIFYLGGNEGISQPYSITIGSAQVTGLRCLQNKLELYRPYDKDTYSLTSGTKASRTASEPLGKRGLPPDAQSDQLGEGWNLIHKEGPINLPIKLGSNTYKIERHGGDSLGFPWELVQYSGPNHVTKIQPLLNLICESESDVPDEMGCGKDK
jgi:hypothetical protein